MIRSIQPLPEEPSPVSTPAPEGVPALSLEGLARIRTAEAVVVEAVEGAPALRRRLLEAGFTAGSRVRFVMATPFGDPLVFSLRGASIALRKTEARCVRVRF